MDERLDDKLSNLTMKFLESLCEPGETVPILTDPTIGVQAVDLEWVCAKLGLDPMTELERIKADPFLGRHVRQVDVRTVPSKAIPVPPTTETGPVIQREWSPTLGEYLPVLHQDASDRTTNIDEILDNMAIDPKARQDMRAYFKSHPNAKFEYGTQGGTEKPELWMPKETLVDFGQWLIATGRSEDVQKTKDFIAWARETL